MNARDRILHNRKVEAEDRNLPEKAGGAPYLSASLPVSEAKNAWEVGDGKVAYRTDDHVTDSKYVWKFLDGRTIGDAASSADWASADASDLFSFLWTHGEDTYMPMLTSAGAASSRGASAAADWAAHKRLTIPDSQQRAAVGARPVGGIPIVGENDGKAIGSREYGELDHATLLSRLSVIIGDLTHLQSGSGTIKTSSHESPVTVAHGGDHQVIPYTTPNYHTVSDGSSSVDTHAVGSPGVTFTPYMDPNNDDRKHHLGYLAEGRFICAKVAT